MTTQPAGVCKALVFVFALAAQPALAQIQPKGWPNAGPGAQVVKPAPGATTKAGAAEPKAAKPRSRRVAVIAKPPAAPAADAMLAEVRAVLQQQVALLEQLAAELESQRLVMRDQLSMIRALEKKSRSGTSHGTFAAAPAPMSPIAITARAFTLTVSGDPHRRGAWFDQTGKNEQRGTLFTGELFGVKLELAGGRTRPITGAGAFVRPQ